MLYINFFSGKNLKIDLRKLLLDQILLLALHDNYFWVKPNYGKTKYL
jgi:hypothetical protein